LFKDSLAVLDDLTDEQAGLLFKAIKAYQCDEEFTFDALTKIAFSPFKSQFERNELSYVSTVKANQINGLKGGRPKKPKITQNNPNKPNGLNINPNNHDSDSDSDSKSVSDSVSVIGSEKTKTVALPLDYSVLGFTDNQIKDLKAIRRKNKGTALTQRIVNALSKEFHEAASYGFTFEQLLTEWEVRGWKSFKAEWVKPKSNQNSGNSRTENNINATRSFLNG